MLGPLSATVTLTTPAPLDAAWAAFSTPLRWPEVLPDLESARIDPSGALRAGAVIRTIPHPHLPIIEMDYHVLEVEPNESLVLHSRAGGFNARTRYAFAPVDETDAAAGTTITITAEVVPERLRGRIMSTLLRSKFNEEVEKSVRRRSGALIELAEKMAGVAEAEA